MTVHLVGAGPGDPGLLTLRGAELLASADVVVVDRLVDPRVVALAKPGAVLIDVGKRPGQLQRQQDINDLLVEHARSGRCVVRLKGGDPFLFGRGGEEAAALRQAGMAFEVVPGVSSAIAAPAYAGIPVTHRGIASSVTVVTGHVDDGGGTPSVDWESLARAGGTLVVLMGMATRTEIARRLVSGGRPASTPVAVVSWGTTPAQQVVRTTLGELGEVDLGPPSAIVVGGVAALDLSWFGRRPLHGLSTVVTRPRAQSARLVSALSHAGAEVVELPAIAVVDPEDCGAGLRRELRDVGSYDWIVITSVNAARRVLDALDDIRDLAGVKLAAAGPATASLLRSWRLTVDLVPRVAGAAPLAEAMPPFAPRSDGLVGSGTTPEAARAKQPTGKILFPRAHEARDELPAGLRSKGWSVSEVEAYRTVPASSVEEPDPRAIERSARAGIAVFASPSAVTSYVSMHGGAAVPGYAACIGPTTAAAAGEAGFSVEVVPASPRPEELVDALSRWWSPRRPPEEVLQ